MLDNLSRYTNYALLALVFTFISPQLFAAGINEPIDLNIPAQSLDKSVTELAKQSGLMIGGDAALLRGRQAPAIQGTYTAEQALQKLLSGTGLIFQISDNKVTLKQVEEVNALQMSPIAITTSNIGGSSSAMNVTKIDMAELERLNPQDIQDVFRGTPGVQVGSSLPISQKVFVNGVEETNLSVTVDGARQVNKLFHHTGNNIIDPELLKAARVDSGVAPADAGPGALGGSITYETKDAADLLAPGDNFGGALGGEYQSNGNTFTTDFTLFGRAGGFEVLGYLKDASGNNFDNGHGDQVNGSAANLKSGLIKLGYLHDSGYRAKVSFENVKDDDAARPFRANFAGRNPGDLTNTAIYSIERETFVASIKDETPEGLFNPYATIAHGESEIARNAQYGTYLSVNGKLANEFVFDMGTVDAGVDFYDDYSNGSFASYDIEENANNIGVFIQARLEPIERARVSFGGRYDSHEFEGVDGSESDNDGLSANISGEFDLTSFLTASAGASHVFGGVQLAEPFIANQNWTYPAGGIRPSEANNGFVGLELRGDGLSPILSNITLGGKVFSTDINDIRDENFNNGPALYSELESTGYEINSRYDWQSGFFRIAYSDIDTEVDGVAGSTAGHYVGTAVGESIKADIFHSFPDLGISMGADVQSFFSLDGTDTFSTPSFQEDAFSSYTVANAFISYTPQSYDYLTLRASVNNMFDENYSDRATYGQEYTETFNTQILNEPGRSFGLSAKLRF